MTPTRVTSNASCNWVNLVQSSSVQFSLSAVNTALEFRVMGLLLRVAIWAIRVMVRVYG